MKIFSRNIVFATVVALTLVSISVSSVFAEAPATGNSVQNSPQGLEVKWKDQLTALQRYKFLESQIPKWMGVWQLGHSSSSRAKKNRYINEVRLALKQAEMIASQHAGFDGKGNVINRKQAAHSVKQLSLYLQQLRALFRHKFNHGLKRRH